MKTTTFDDYIPKIYAAHGKGTPERIYLENVWDRIQGLPDAFLPWATAKLADYDKLPGNLGRELGVELFSSWLSETRSRAPDQRGCRDCDATTPGWFFGWRDDGTSVLLKCACNADRKFADVPAVSPYRLTELGLMRRGEYLALRQAKRACGELPSRLDRTEVAAMVGIPETRDVQPFPAPAYVLPPDMPQSMEEFYALPFD